MNKHLTNLIAFFAVVLVNGLANGLPIAGRTTGEISDRYPNLFTPDGYTFSIWGLIYLSLFLFVLYPLFKQNQSYISIQQKIGTLFLGTCAVNISWILAWHHLMINISWLLMITLLILLIKIYQQLRTFQNDLSPIRYVVYVPFSLYLGWICVATIANTTILLVDTGFNEYLNPAYIWCVLILIVAFILGLFFLTKYHDTIIAAVISWAMVGIYVKLKQSFVPVEDPWIQAPLILSICIALFAVWKIIRRERIYLIKGP